MYICVDFDGTIVDHVYPKIGEPVPGAIPWLKRFNQLGAKIILFTMRSDSNDCGQVLTPAIWFLKRNGVELFGLNRNPEQDKWSLSPKAYGNLYIDDAAFGCPKIHPKGFQNPCADWSIIGPQVEALITK